MLATKSAAALSLQSMFDRFTDASSKLEKKYAALLQETEQLKAELRQKDEEIRRTERLAMLGETAAALAHEVRNPLGAISLFVSLLRQDVTDRPQALQMLDEIGRSISSLNGVVSNILHFAKNKPNTRVPVNIQAVLLEFQQHFNAAMSGEGRIELNINGDPLVMGDEHGLRQVFYNLLANAAKAVAHKGKIQISVTGNTDNLDITISDSGPGIPEQILPKIFDPFVSGRPDGTGLGLAIVKQILTQHGAEITACNKQGACFKIVLPRSNAKNIQAGR